MSREQKVKGTSPIGQAQWFKLIKPDQKFNKYSVDLVVEDSDAVQSLLNQIEEMTAAALANAKEKQVDKSKLAKMKGDSGNRPVEKQLDSEGNHTGKYIMKFRLSSEGKKKDGEIYKIAPPALFNNKNQPYGTEDKNALQVPNGSLLQVSYELSPYYVSSTGAGVSLRPTAAKVHKIQSIADANQFGFSDAEFNAQDASDDNEFSATAESNNGSDSDSDF